MKTAEEIRNKGRRSRPLIQKVDVEKAIELFGKAIGMTLDYESCVSLTIKRTTLETGLKALLSSGYMGNNKMREAKEDWTAEEFLQQKNLPYEAYCDHDQTIIDLRSLLREFAALSSPVIPEGGSKHLQ